MGSYTETSPSGRGVKIFTKGETPDGKGHVTKNVPFTELCLFPKARYFTLTGDHLEGTPDTIEPAQDAINALCDKYFADCRIDDATQEPNNESAAFAVDRAWADE